MKYNPHQRVIQNDFKMFYLLGFLNEKQLLRETKNVARSIFRHSEMIKIKPFFMIKYIEY